MEAWKEEATRAACKKINGRALAKATREAKARGACVYVVASKKGWRIFDVAPMVQEPCLRAWQVSTEGKATQWQVQ